MHDLRITCDRCDRPLEALQADLDSWVLLDARDDGWAQALCADCQAARAREVVMLLLDG